MRQFVNKFRNSSFYLFIASFLEKFEMEGFTVSYSQGAEDLILKKLIGKNFRNGFYVDIGCNNPIQGSNTVKLYLKGWHGICIDGNSNLVKKFRQIRKRDVVLAAVLSDKKTTATFYQSDDEDCLSTVSVGTAEKLVEQKLKVQQVHVTTTTLEETLDSALNGQKIDFMSVDVEGHDLQVLQGNNFEKYRPTIICVECSVTLNDVRENAIASFLLNKGYDIVASCSANLFFRDRLSK
jgi:FkbM family methyltransferase